jgi:phage shock protein A
MECAESLAAGNQEPGGKADSRNPRESKEPTMSIFTRFKDIVGANINAMLDKAEKPERLLRLMIQDMEDALVDTKATCAQAMAERARARRNADRLQGEVARWDERAALALSKGREDMAREALLRKREVVADATRVADEVHSLSEKIAAHQNEIVQVEDKLLEARDKLLTLSARKQTERATAADAQKPSPFEKSARDAEIEKELSELKAKLNNNNSTK